MKINIKKDRLNKQVGLNLSDSVYQKLKDISIKNGISVQELLRYIIDNFLNDLNTEKKERI